MHRWMPFVVLVAGACTQTFPIALEPTDAAVVVATSDPVTEPPTLIPVIVAPPESPLPAPVEPVEALPLEARTWFLWIDREPFTLTLPADSTETGTLTDATNQGEPVTDASGPDASGWLRFRTMWRGSSAWFHLRVAAGVLSGRWSHGGTPPDYSLAKGHVTGWNQGAFEKTSARVYRLKTESGDLFSLRLDGLFDEAGLTGRWKKTGSIANGRVDESDELEIEVTSWHPPALGFRLIGDQRERVCDATLLPTTVLATCVAPNGTSESFTGERIEVLTFGLKPKPLDARTDWQTRTRQALALLAMGGIPTANEVRLVTSGAPLRPLPEQACLPERDDDQTNFPANYTRQELELDARYVNADGVEHLRRLHGWLLVPTDAPPAGGFPAMVAVNGHSGSARMLTDPDNGAFWYGESFARRGYVVFALDVSHRPVTQRIAYTDYPNGDAPGDGNGSHPAITFGSQDSDWEEEGERASDAMSVRRFLAGQAFVDERRIGVMGLSMGGTVTTWAAAMDTGFALAIPAGFSPDTEVLRISSNHPCFVWLNADSTTYVTTSDLQALVAPRRLVVESGARDWVFSGTGTPFAQDKQVTRRSRAAWAPENGAGFVHYLHDDFHQFHVGSVSCGGKSASGLTIPLQSAPSESALVSWQTTSETEVLASDLYQWLSVSQ